MNLREEFKKETGLRTIIEDGIGNSFYTEDYVEWLENRVKKLSISDVRSSKYSSKSGLKGNDITPYSEWAKKETCKIYYL
jgi:hypothetical protein